MTDATKQCGECKTVKPIEEFKLCGKKGLRERHCLACRYWRSMAAERKRRARWKGVDIDRIHYLRGAVRTREQLEQSLATLEEKLAL